MKKTRNKFKTALLGCAAIATSLLIGFGVSCAKKNESDNEEEKVTTKQDTQIIKNGNFEFYGDNKGVYPISTPDSWTISTKGSSSSSMSGVINTRKDRWDYVTDTTLPAKLESNNKLDSDDENKVNYNGALTDDMPFADPHTATESKHEIVSSDYIANPYTHEYSYTSDGTVKNASGETVEVHKNDDGDYLLADDTPFETSVLMIHNYRNNYFTGTETYYTSNSSVTLEAGTACEISMWVKTDELYFDGSSNKRTEVTFDRGAYIKAALTVGGNGVEESFMIKNINTQQLNPKPADENAAWENNGWVKYTLYVEASTFATTELTLTLGLGNDSVYTVEGYAFFDDITFTKYVSNTEMHEKVDEVNGPGYYNSKITANNTCLPLDPDGSFEFRADKETAKTNNSNGELITWTDEHNFNDRHFLLNFASTDNDAIDLTAGGASVALTVDTNNYVCSKSDAYTLDGITVTDGNSKVNGAYLSTKVGEGIDVSNDVLATFNITNDENWAFPCTTFDDSNKLKATLTDALKTAAELPDVENGQTSAMFIMSAYGAAYEMQLTDAKFTLEKDSYALISFWIKNSDMKGNGAATVTVIDANDEKNKSSYTVDSTTVSKDAEGYFEGWTRCFIRVSNVAEEDKTFIIKYNFGNTTIKGKDKNGYYSGWMAIANFTLTELKDNVYGYTSSSSNCTTLDFSDKKPDNSHNFDEEKASSRSDIENGLALPSSYTGVNGASSSVKPSVTLTDIDKLNDNDYSGLINKNYVENYKQLLSENDNWFSALAAVLSFNDATADGEIWQKIAGDNTVVQPMIIVNAVRQFNEVSKVYNYGYYGNTTTVSAGNYASVSVRVKVSDNAVASVYLVDDSNEHNVLTYKTPAYTFWYDDNGNVLKSKPDASWTNAQKKANIAYTLREDGLYEKDGELYANLYNLSTLIDVNYYEAMDQNARKGYYFYDTESASGEYLSVENAAKRANLKTFLSSVAAENFCYSDDTRTAYGNHYLVAGQEKNNKVYQYRSGLGKNATYYYMEKGEPNTAKVVHAFNTEYAALRYDTSSAEATPYQFTIDTTTAEGAKYANKWVTVTFNIRAGSNAVKYRLELWSGYRDQASTENVAENSYVMFDYSNISLDESTYNTWLGDYTKEIANDYKESITDKLENNDASLAELEKLAGADSDPAKRSTVYDKYVANYFTYSLYDSAEFIPFNSLTAEDNKTGYSYAYSDYDESLALFMVEDYNNLSMTAFVDYSVIDKDIDIIGAPTVDESEEDNHNHERNTNVWLLAASIALVVAILIAIVAIFLKDYLKKHRRKTTTTKNSYNFKKNKRYVKKYVKANGEAPEVTDEDVDKSLLEDGAAEEANTVEETPAEEAPSEEPNAEEISVEQAPAEEAPVEEKPVEEAPVEEAPAEESTSPAEESADEKPSEEKPADEAKSEDNDKPDGADKE